jgi:secondary thiamine-phosphate synthase enzyme
MERLTIETRSREELLDITSRLREIVERPGCKAAACLVFCPHTTAGLTINEHADPSVARDIAAAIAPLVPEGRPWRHLEGNAPAHVKASLIGSSVTIPMEEGRLALGTWQGLFLCEFDGPRTREVWVRLLA